MTSKPKTVVTFYNGLTTIGGPMIEVAYDKSHVLFDLGEVYKPDLGLSIEDEDYQTLIKYQLIGDVKNFYDPQITGQPIDGERWHHAAAYISHVHLDHSKAVNLIAPEIPVYAGPITANLLPALNQNGDFLLPAAGHDKSYTRSITGVELGHPIKIGDITLEIVASDHDAYGATGLIIKTPDKTIVHTGDIRLHGYHPDWVREFMAKGNKCDLLIIEGTGVSFPDEDGEEFSGPKNEQELTEQIIQYQKQNLRRQLTFNTYPTNVERILRIIADSPRKVVLHAERAALLKRALGQDIPYYYLPEDQKIDALNSELEISYSDLLEDDHQYFWQVVGHYDQLKAGGLYIHSNAQPLGNFDPAYRPFIENIEKRGIELIPLRCSGHAGVDELKEIIAGFEPKILAPVHTLHPELEENPFGVRILPKRGESLELS